MLNAMVEPVCAFANVTASRKVQVPVPVVAHALVESPASLTVTVAAATVAADAKSARSVAENTAAMRGCLTWIAGAEMFHLASTLAGRRLSQEVSCFARFNDRLEWKGPL